MPSPLLDLATQLFHKRKVAGWTPERLAAAIKENQRGNGKTDAYLAFTKPYDFVQSSLPADPAIQREFYRQIEPLDLGKMSTLPTPWKMVDDVTNSFIGHEGRHRSQALGDAGFDLIPYIMDLRELPRLSKDDVQSLRLLWSEPNSAISNSFSRLLVPLHGDNEGPLRRIMDMTTERYARGGRVPR